jgi:hypothetical protein
VDGGRKRRRDGGAYVEDFKKNIIHPVTVKAILTKKIKNVQNEIHK